MNAIRNSSLLIPTLLVWLSQTIVIPLRAQIFETLHGFDGTEGSYPVASLVLSGNTLYGTLTSGGTANDGTVFAIKTDGSSPTRLHSFTGADGIKPHSGLTISGSTLYGTTFSGGLLGAGTAGGEGNGTVFKIGVDGSGFTNLHLFARGSGSWPNMYNSDGVSPSGRLVLSGQRLFGVAEYGGEFGAGVLFAVNTDGTGFTNLHSFSPGEGSSPNSLILSGGELYGTTFAGATGGGSVFAISTEGTGFRNLHPFSADGAGGRHPVGRLVLSGRTLYGTTSGGGAGAVVSLYGTVFALNTDGSGFVVLHWFNGRDEGSDPWGGLALWDNTLYGITTFSGTNGPGGQNVGDIFAVATDGTAFTVLHKFNVSTNGSAPNGQNPWGTLALSGNRLYGTTSAGGTANHGTVFSLEIVTDLSFAPYHGSLILTWPLQPSGFRLESATNLLSPVWQAVASSPVDFEGQNLVIEPDSGTQGFYRLAP